MPIRPRRTRKSPMGNTVLTCPRAGVERKGYYTHRREESETRMKINHAFTGVVALAVVAGLASAQDAPKKKAPPASPAMDTSNKNHPRIPRGGGARCRSGPRQPPGRPQEEGPPRQSGDGHLRHARRK